MGPTLRASQASIVLSIHIIQFIQFNLLIKNPNLAQPTQQHRDEEEDFPTHRNETFEVRRCQELDLSLRIGNRWCSARKHPPPPHARTKKPSTPLAAPAPISIPSRNVRYFLHCHFHFQIKMKFIIFMIIEVLMESSGLLCYVLIYY